MANTVTLNVADDATGSDATLDLSGNGNFVYANNTMDPAGEAFATVDASDMTGTLDYTNAAGLEETITLGEENGSDTLNVVDGSTYGSMDVIQNFNSTAAAAGEDMTADVLTGITGSANQVDVSQAGSLNAAFSAAAQADGAAVDGDFFFFQFEDDTYAFADTATDGTAGQYDNGDFAIEIAGVHDLSANNEAYA
ncbi:hypothetical protein MHM84_11680 [Halomonas sp. McH1-25]|uniref:hypothetical protein n=1 Tax=unclassified Halomonas TaxID=2609666 RepID=UPI001EF541F0|nr:MULTISPECIES: hypothetical protein [unclassified Halomonas]MCG7600451.1 hypothetical protein [Halomonas sp. McH1-25]MCP1342950.1 hypothetical protein [Halomonas sp. FL8]MCP1359958.1 hypothetical protein [Halomonas sp. BBD45]MCP1364345.1 hypothetical protein [Halomonas sp. BBD48]